MLSKFWYRQAMVCFALWVSGLVVLVILRPVKWVVVVFVAAGLFLCVVSFAVGLWMTRCPHCKWRLWAALSRGCTTPTVYSCVPAAGNPSS